MEKKQSIIKHFLVIGSGTVLNMLIGLITTPVITRKVDPVEYGQLSIFIMYCTLAVMILCLGLDQALVRFYYEDDSIEYRRTLLSKCIKYPIIITLGLSILTICLSGLDVLKFEFSTQIMVLLCICVVIQLLYRFSLLLVRLAYKSKKYSLLNVLNKTCYFIIAVICLNIVKNHELFIMVVATVVSYFICFIASVIMQAEEWDLRSINKKACSVPQKELLKYAAPFIVSMSVTQLFHAIDKISLNHYCTYVEVGIYSSTMTLVQIFAIVQTSFNTIWAPMQVEHYTKDPDDHTFYQRGNQCITFVMFFIGLSLILVKDVFAILLGTKYREAAYILPFLIFNPIMYTISETTCGGMVFKKKSKMQVVVAVGACVTNIIGNTILVPILGCKGAAISTGVSYIVFFTLRTLIANKYYYTDFKLPKLYTITALTCIYAYYNTFYKLSIWSIVGYIVCVSVLFLLYRDTVSFGMQYVAKLIKNYIKK